MFFSLVHFLIPVQFIFVLTNEKNTSAPCIYIFIYIYIYTKASVFNIALTVLNDENSHGFNIR